MRACIAAMVIWGIMSGSQTALAGGSKEAKFFFEFPERMKVVPTGLGWNEGVKTVVRVLGLRF